MTMIPTTVISLFRPVANKVNELYFIRMNTLCVSRANLSTFSCNLASKSITPFSIVLLKAVWATFLPSNIYLYTYSKGEANVLIEGLSNRALSNS